MEVAIRPLTPKDIDSVSRVIQLTVKISQGKIYPPALIKEFSKKYEPDNIRKRAKEIEYFVAEVNGEGVIGIVGLQKNQLRTFYVHPDFQGKGVGRKLFTRVEHVALERGIEKLVIEGSPLGEPMYLRFGFTKIKTLEKSRAGIPYTDAYMEKLLR